MNKVLLCIFAVGLPIFSVVGFSSLDGGDGADNQVSPLYRHAIEVSAEGQKEGVANIEKPLTADSGAQSLNGNCCPNGTGSTSNNLAASGPCTSGIACSRSTRCIGGSICTVSRCSSGMKCTTDGCETKFSVCRNTR